MDQTAADGSAPRLRCHEAPPSVDSNSPPADALPAQTIDGFAGSTASVLIAAPGGPCEVHRPMTAARADGTAESAANIAAVRARNRSARITPPQGIRIRAVGGQ